MSYQALYRSWRPQTFSDLVGQPHVKQTLTNALERGQVAHAYLFCGPRGTGKTSAAKVLAKAVNCLSPNGVEPCNMCEACQSINSGSNVDVEEIDAASNRGVDEIRQLRDKVGYAPANLQRKVYIVDEVHMLTTEAFNALLKTLEEPPGHTLFVLATTEPHKIPGTIVSRCQRFDFRRITPEVIVQRLQEVCAAQDWQSEAEALWKIAEAADGGLRDALGLLEQTAAYSHGELTATNAAHVLGGVEASSLLALVKCLVQEDLLEVMQQLMEWYAAGKDPARIVHEILQVLRDLFIVRLSKGDTDLGRREGYREVATLCQQEWLLEAVKKLGETYVNLRFVDQPRLALEAALLGLVPRAETVRASHERASAPAASAPADHRSAADHRSTADHRSEADHRSTADGKLPPAAADSGSRRTTEKAATHSPRASGARKMEVLKQLHEQSSAEQLQSIHSRWEDVLQAVKSHRIQTHAWLINGEVVLATNDTVVVAFSSRIHRDAVMKPDERDTIQTALDQVCGTPIQLLALLQSDWDAFKKTLETGATAQAPGEANHSEQDLAHRAVQLFGQEIVEIKPEE